MAMAKVLNFKDTNVEKNLLRWKKQLFCRVDTSYCNYTCKKTYWIDTWPLLVEDLFRFAIADKENNRGEDLRPIK